MTPMLDARLQVVLDCVDPHAMADFWSAALGYEIDADPEMIRDFVDRGLAPAEATMERNGVLVWVDATAMHDPSGQRPRWYFQRVPESKSAKNRLHLDFQFLPPDLEARADAVAHLESLGAVRLYEGQQGPHTWLTMADPEGNEFCVS